MSEMVERAARAIARVLTDEGLPVSHPDDGRLDDVEMARWEATVLAARAAIGALREPTGGMLSAAAGALKGYIDALPAEVKAKTNKPRGYVLADSKTKHRVRYQAMVDEALR